MLLHNASNQRSQDQASNRCATLRHTTPQYATYCLSNHANLRQTTADYSIRRLIHRGPYTFLNGSELMRWRSRHFVARGTRDVGLTRIVWPNGNTGKHEACIPCISRSMADHFCCIALNDLMKTAMGRGVPCTFSRCAKVQE